MKNAQEGRLSLGWALALGAAAGAGLWARLAGFGSRGLAVDETYFAYSAAAILEHGVPSLLGGGYYVVGLIPQYLTALSVALFGPGEAALRLPALLGGLALPPLAYRYVRGHGAPAVAAAVAVALFLSSWQIEFSRFGRMYSIFGCAVLLLLTRFDRSLAGPEWGRRYRTHLWAVVAVACHREGALLAPLLFAPLLDASRFPTKSARMRYALVTSLVVGVIALFATVDFRRLGMDGLYPQQYQPPDVSVLRLPAAPLWGGTPSWALAVIPAVLTAVFAYAWRRRLSEQATIASLAIAAALLHQLALAGLLVFVLAARSAWDDVLARRLALVAACSAAWPLFAIASGANLLVEGAGSALGSIRLLFFGWPQLYEAIVLPWASALPWLGALIGAALALSLVREARPWLEALGSPAGVAAYGILCFGLVRYFYDGTRYHYFLYPALLAVVAVAAARLLGPVRGPAAFLVAFALTGDFDPRHIADPAGEAASLRIGPFEGRGELWYPRADYRAAAQALSRLAAEGSGVVVGTAEPVPYYFDGNFARYLDRAEYPFWEQSRRRGAVEMWTGRGLLSTAEELRAWSRPYDSILLVRRRPGDLAELDPSRVWGERLLAAETVFAGRGGRVDIVRVTLGDLPGATR